MTGALTGVTVLDLSNYLTGPYAAMMLGDAGANVIKIEQPGRGDPFRGAEEPGVASAFHVINRNKRGICLNLKSARGRDIFLSLADEADVIIQNFRPGVVEVMGIDYETVRGRNPGIVYCSISAFGSDGPYRDYPGYDTIGQAMGGLLSVVTDLQDPKPTGISFSDHLTGLFAGYGILLALQARTLTGVGQKVETSLLQSTASFIQESVTRYYSTGAVPHRETRVMSAQVYAFVAGDGKPFVVHLSTPPKFWEGLAQAIGLSELIRDPRFCRKEDRRKNYPTLHAILAGAFALRPRDEWLAELRARDVPCAPLYTVDEVMADPQVQHLGMPHELQHAVAGRVRFSGSAVHLTETPVTYRSASPYSASTPTRCW